MDCRNKLIFKYYVHLPDGSRRLHLSRVEEIIGYSDFADMMSKIKHIIALKISIVGSISVYFPNCEGREDVLVTADNCSIVRYNDTLTVVIDVASD